ncbi:hypothetical protein KO527_05495 [Pseudoalteromonas sp. C2R02]|uniref:defense against restriction DarA-related protein n=1 Tax=Pseudoalteromonas sp. C2R02 TaxID=2841565 RepID=UPI001C08CDB4|nr:hypothetical protein [Pseudoalteromonas sp. C2R02]MBU2968803.1 hypothetical protein [Pseudoalteromonas sp. C2R02]
MLTAKNSKKQEVIDFDNVNESGLKDVVKHFKTNKLEVIDLAATNRKTKRNGLMSKKAVFVFMGGQTCEMRINETGDIYQVLINSKVTPVREHSKLKDLVKEIAKKVTSQQEKFDKSILKKIEKATRMNAKQDKAGQPVTAKAKLSQVNERLTKAKANITKLTEEKQQIITNNEKIQTDTDALIASYKSDQNTIKQLQDTLASRKAA